jgi:hypothetical protein
VQYFSPVPPGWFLIDAEREKGKSKGKIKRGGYFE